MKRRVLSLLLAICLVAGMLPSVTLAAEQETTAEQPVTENVTVTLSESVTWEAEPDDCYYAITSTAGVVTDLGKLDAEPANWHIKLNNTNAGAELTLKGAIIKSGSSKAIEATGGGAMKIIVEGASWLQTDKADTLTLSMGGGATITSRNNSQLAVELTKAGNYYCFQVLQGGLTLDHANLTVSSKNSHYAAYQAMTVVGDMDIKGGTLEVTAGGKDG